MRAPIRCEVIAGCMAGCHTLEELGVFWKTWSEYGRSTNQKKNPRTRHDKNRKNEKSQTPAPSKRKPVAFLLSKRSASTLDRHQLMFHFGPCFAHYYRVSSILSPPQNESPQIKNHQTAKSSQNQQTQKYPQNQDMTFLKNKPENRKKNSPKSNKKTLEHKTKSANKTRQKSKK